MFSFFESVISFFDLIFQLLGSFFDSMVMMFKVLGLGSFLTSNISFITPTILGSACLVIFAVGTLKLILSVF